jgi:glycolate oxidase FAD binding subunit
MFAGAARDFVLGTRLLTAQGELLRFGGKVMKNVAGFDVSRLLCGSLGIFGILAEVSLKVLPLPRLEETRRLELSAGEAVTAFNRWAGLPLPLSGAAWWQGSAWVRLSGAPAAVRTALDEIGGDQVAAAEAERFWSALRHCQLPLFAAESLWRLSLPQAAAPLDMPSEPLIDWGGALRWYANVPPDVDVRERARSRQGTALHWRGSASAGRFPPVAAPIANLHRRLKQRFDPRQVDGRPLSALGAAADERVLEGDRAPADLDDIAAHQHLPLRVDAQPQRRGPARVLALCDLELARQRQAGREAPAAEVRRCGAGRRILEHRATLGEKEARQQS